MRKFTIDEIQDPANLYECSRRVVRTSPAVRYLRHFTQSGGSVEDAESIAALTILRLGVVPTLSVGTNFRRWSGYVAAEYRKERRRNRVYEGNGEADRSDGSCRSLSRKNRFKRYAFNREHEIDTKAASYSCGEDIFDEIPDETDREWLRNYYTNVEGRRPSDRERARRMRNKYRGRIIAAAY